MYTARYRYKRAHTLKAVSYRCSGSLQTPAAATWGFGTVRDGLITTRHGTTVHTGHQHSQHKMMLNFSPTRAHENSRQQEHEAVLPSEDGSATNPMATR